MNFHIFRVNLNAQNARCVVRACESAGARVCLRARQIRVSLKSMIELFKTQQQHVRNVFFNVFSNSCFLRCFSQFHSFHPSKITISCSRELDRWLNCAHVCAIVYERFSVIRSFIKMQSMFVTRFEQNQAKHTYTANGSKTRRGKPRERERDQTRSLSTMLTRSKTLKNVLFSK